MTPKALSPVAKQAKILKWLRESSGVYSQRELEKLLPSVASIHQAQVKEYIQKLLNENEIRVEKIGSSNWYWSFLSDAKRAKECLINNQAIEALKLTGSIDEMERQIEQESANRGHDSKTLESYSKDRQALMGTNEGLVRKVEDLDHALAVYSNRDPTEMLRKQDEIMRFKEDADRWTNHLESLEYYLVQFTGDHLKIAELLGSYCGDEYMVGEGLRAL